MVGLLDFFTGGDPTEMAQIDPRYGVPKSDVRDAAVNTLANISATLLAAGQPIMPAQRAQIFSQLGQAASGFNTDLYNASQRRLMAAQMEARRAEGEELKQIQDLMKNPEAFKARTGYDLQQFGGMRAQDISQALRQIRIQRLGRDPLEAEQRQLQVEQLRRTMNEPRTVEAGGALYQFNSQTQRWDRVTEPRPQGGLEGDAQATILQGMRNPAMVNTPEYAVAFTRLYGPRTEIRNGEVVTIQPEVPVGVPRPSAAAAAAAAPAAPAGEASAALGAPQAPPGGDTRTVTTPGGGQVSITSTQPRALSPDELKLKEETESNLQSMRDAEGSLREALRLSPQAYAGPGAGLRGAAAGATGFDQNSAVATRSLTSIMTEQALSQLRSIFGGNPTEGERKILLDMGASANMSRAEREALLNRAIDAVQRRQSAAERRLREVGSGEYGRVQPGYTPPAAAPSAPALPPGFEVVR
jgi:hypothetical protein